jgi:hypothetical protein
MFLRFARVGLRSRCDQCVYRERDATETRVEQIHHHKHWNQILRLRFRQFSDTAKSILAQDSCRPAFHVRDLCHLQEVRPGSGFQTIAHMVENGGEHTPAHALAELDEASGESVARLGQILDHTAGSVVATGDGGDGDFVAEVAQLEGCVGTAVDSGLIDLGGGILFQRAS